ncbi:hypothetical protein GCM10022421_08940 [Oceanisphaera sediminis]|uniref:Uncharacterized protein n=1 Tax=Oceanisphaera sediminis TaxID=981381 RepID=A0ABP7DH90_9GAMM
MDHDVIEPLLAHLAQQCPDIPTIDEAWFAAPLDRFDEQCPAVMPYLAEERIRGPVATLRPVQPVSLVYGLWIVCPRAVFRTVRQNVADALFGHQFSERHDPAAYMGGKVDDIRGNLIWWQEFWTVDSHRRTTP